MTALALLTVWSYKLGSLFFNSAIPVIISMSSIAYNNTVRSNACQAESKIILNTLVYSIIYSVFYNLILLSFNINFLIVCKLFLIQVSIIIYFIAASFADKRKFIYKAFFYVISFGTLIFLLIYGVYKNFLFIDIVLISESISSVTSALFIGFISLISSKKN